MRPCQACWTVDHVFFVSSACWRQAMYESERRAYRGERSIPQVNSHLLAGLPIATRLALVNPRKFQAVVACR